MFQSPAIIKTWDVCIINSDKVIVPLKMDQSGVDIKTDDENILIRTFRLQQKENESISSDSNDKKKDICPIQIVKRPQHT